MVNLAIDVSSWVTTQTCKAIWLDVGEDSSKLVLVSGEVTSWIDSTYNVVWQDRVSATITADIDD